MESLQARGSTLGQAKVEVGEQSSVLGRGDKLLLFTDGCSEFVVGGRMLGAKGLGRLLERCDGPLSRDLTVLQTAFAQAPNPDDDLSFVLLTLHPSGAP